MSDTEIRDAIASARLFSVFHGVFAVGGPDVTVIGRAMAAMLACEKGAVVSHRSAAHLLGLVDRAPASVDVIPLRWRGRKIAGIRPHFVPKPGTKEAGACEGIRCTSPSRTLVDLAGVLGKKSLRGAVEQAAVERILRPVEILGLLAGPRRRGAPALRTILADWISDEAASQLLRSRMEARALALFARHGLPAPQCNERVFVAGRRYEVDMLWQAASLVVELDSRRHHSQPSAFERDRFRTRELLLGGYRVMPVTWAQLEGEPERIAAAIRRMLELSAATRPRPR